MLPDMGPVQEQQLSTTYGTTATNLKMNTSDKIEDYDSDSTFSGEAPQKEPDVPQEKTYWHPIMVVLLMLIVDGFGYVMSMAP